MLTWETKINTTPTVTTKAAHMAEEPDSNLWEYYIDADLASDRSSLITLGNYVDPHWSVPARHLTSQKVKRIGIKHFPQVGAIGFFTYLNEERSKILAPVHVKTKKYTAPSITVTENETSLIVVISPPIDYGADKSDDLFSDGSDIFDDGDNGEVNTKLKYICHRVIVRLDKFAIEYITYENTIDIPKPVTTGTYDIYCVGYIHEGEAVSEDSNHVYLDITGTQDTWPGPMEGSDLYITDVEVTDENKVHIRRSDGFQKDSDNLIPVPVSMTFLKDGKLQMTLNTGEVVTSNNSSPGGGGGGGGASLYLKAATPVVPGVDSFKVQSDTVLADGITKDAFTLSDNVDSVERLNNLEVSVKLLNQASLGDIISLKANRDAYLNNNGVSDELIIEVSEPTFEELLGDISLMIQIRTNSKNDDGIDTFTTDTQYYPDVWAFPETYDPVQCKSFGVSGNSFVNIGSVPHVVNVNQRDAASYNVYKQEGTAEGIGLVKIRWNGSSAYSGSIDSTWELYLLANGDAFLYIIDYPSNTGTCTLFGKTYKITKDAPVISFYRQDFSGMYFNIEYAMYDKAKHNRNADKVPSMTIADLVGYYAGMTHVLFNSKNDEGTNTCTFTDFVWNSLDKVYVSGNSWIGHTSSSEDIKLNRRDAASYYVFMQKYHLVDIDLTAIRIVWGGSSSYSGSVDQWWELWLFENGDAMIYCYKLGSSTGGASSFYGVSFTPSNGSYHSFYKNGNSWTKEDAIYKPKLGEDIDVTKKAEMMFSDRQVSTEGQFALITDYSFTSVESTIDKGKLAKLEINTEQFTRVDSIVIKEVKS